MFEQLKAITALLFAYSGITLRLRFCVWVHTNTALLFCT